MPVAKRVRDGKVTRRARWRDDRGDQHSRSFRRKVDAERFMTQLEHARLNVAYVDAGVGGVAEWVGTMHLRGLSASRTRQANHLMTSMLDDAVKDGRLVRNAAAGVDLPRLETKPRRCACRMSSFVAGGSRSAGPSRRSKAGSCSAPPSRTRPGGFRCRSCCWREWGRRSAARRLTTWCSPHHGGGYLRVATSDAATSTLPPGRSVDPVSTRTSCGTRRPRWRSLRAPRASVRRRARRRGRPPGRRDEGERCGPDVVPGRSDPGRRPWRRGISGA